MVIKPASDTPITGGLLLGRIFEEDEGANRKLKRREVIKSLNQKCDRMLDRQRFAMYEKIFGPKQPFNDRF